MTRTMLSTTNDIRASFLDFFRTNGHQVVDSAPLVPRNDPSLMFTNAGMVPFKNVFTGLETRAYSQAASAQKCVRAGGKHNDLDNVGYTARHHTFFEMLGNFSFGDYFKEQAITLAWTLITKEWGINPDRLVTTVYHEDEEAFALWQKIAGLPESRIIRIATKDNFWAMGDTGPCGPCSEIFYDHGAHIAGGPPGSPEQDGDRFVEIWNLVFMQFEQIDADTRINLPKPSIDTGMGLERIAAVMQGSHDNFDTDTFKALIEASVQASGQNLPSQRISHRVIADHLRASAFLIADGVLPANDGRGYVLRRIMRRAMRHAHLLGTREPLMHRLTPTLVSQMGAAYPELARAQALMSETLLLEETRFRQTLEKGLRLLDEACSPLQAGDTLSGEVAFKLYDTYGFPYDLTEDALRERGMRVDRAGFDTAMAGQKARARAAWAGSGAQATDTLWFDLAQTHGATDFIGYATLEAQAQVLSLVREGTPLTQAQAGDGVLILANQTPFYGESGGQMGDSGMLTTPSGARVVIEDTQKPLGLLHIHKGRVLEGTLSVGEAITLSVDATRRAQLRASHSATHLLHAALRAHLGEHVTQKGSLVSPGRLRFDIAHPKALTLEELAEVERDVNACIAANSPVTTRLMTPDAAVAAGALALFGEKYGEEVRVVSMGDAFSVELCGGTHVRATGDIGLFKLVSESAVAAGVRRLEALTGSAALAHVNEQEAHLKQAASQLKVAAHELPARLATLLEERKRLERDLAAARKELALSQAGQAQVETLGNTRFMGQSLEGLSAKDLRSQIEGHLAELGEGVVCLIALEDGRASVGVGVSPGLTTLTPPLSAVDLVRLATNALGGQGGGGRATFAQGGGPNVDQASAALEAVRQALREAPAKL